MKPFILAERLVTKSNGKEERKPVIINLLSVEQAHPIGGRTAVDLKKGERIMLACSFDSFLSQVEVAEIESEDEVVEAAPEPEAPAEDPVPEEEKAPEDEPKEEKKPTAKAKPTVKKSTPKKK